MSNPKSWGRIGAWAAEAEAAEAEEREAALAAAAAPAADSESFPSLKEAASTKPKKKKNAVMSLSEFHSAASASSGPRESRGLTPDEMMRLPTGPRQRSEEEFEYGRGGLGGGFRSYGLGGGRRDDMGGGGGRRAYGGFDDERRGAPPPRTSDFDQMPSRADEADNWASSKKQLAPGPLSGMDSGRHDRYEALGGRGGASRADEVDSWASGKKPLSSGYSGFGSGYRDSAPVDSDRWARGTGGQFPSNGDRERPRLVLHPPKGDAGAPNEPVKTTRPSPFGAARPREEVLAEKGLDWKRLEAEIETKKTSRPTSSHSSRPSSAQSSRTQSPPRQLGGAEVVVKPRPKVNPFGDAKPREVVLQEQGKDWKRIDFELEHRGVDRPETEEEKSLKKEISELNELLAKETEVNQNGEGIQFSAEELASLQQRRDAMEKELERLTRELDDKVRFGQKAPGDRRPGSGSGRLSVFSDRPPSQSGMSDDARSMDFAERPRSRGGVGDMWSKAVDDRRSYQLGGTEGGFLGNRNIDRSRSRERW